MGKIERVKCPHCNTGKVSCSVCFGKGQVSDGSFQNRKVTCTRCHGSGVLFCRQCNGSGQIERVSAT